MKEEKKELRKAIIDQAMVIVGKNAPVEEVLRVAKLIEEFIEGD